MATNTLTHSRRTSLAWSAVFRAARLLTFGFLGWVWLLSADDPSPSLKAVSLIAVLGLATTVSVSWYLSRARAERRWRAAWNRYAGEEQEWAMGTSPRSSQRSPHS
jgi:hypothetical protein